MRKSIALTCLLFALVANATSAQCPTSCGKCVLAPVQTHCKSIPQPTCRIASTRVSAGQIKNRRPVAQGSPVLLGYPVMQGYPVIQSINNSSTQSWSVISQSTVAQNSQYATQSNCSCSGNVTKIPSFASQSSSQAASIVDQRRNPFSLAGHSQEVKPLDYCLQEFLVCCEAGGKNCMQSYFRCAEITGEQLRYNACPTVAPTVDD